MGSLVGAALSARRIVLTYGGREKENARLIFVDLTNKQHCRE